MSIFIEYIYEDDYRLTHEQKELLDRTLKNAAIIESHDYGELSVTLCGNQSIHELNLRYRGIDRPTDVLSFPMEDDELLGDIIISIPKVQSQAEEYGHSFERELCFLAVHGFLHLLGYDHETKEEEEVMISKQERILAQVGLGR
jgi:probable rRNA maturation factor